MKFRSMLEKIGFALTLGCFVVFLAFSFLSVLAISFFGVVGFDEDLIVLIRLSVVVVLLTAPVSLVFLYGLVKEAYVEKQKKEIENMVRDAIKKELGKYASQF